jgi:hypothetical protein
MSPQERKRRLAKQRVDRSHRRTVIVVRERQLPPWTRGEQSVLVLGLAFIFAATVLSLVLFMPLFLP